jgi:hypothetical protein
MKKNNFIVNVVSALTMAWKKRYINISDDQWEQLHWEFFNGCFFVWKHPVHTAAFLIWAPRLIKILSFFYPLLISTILLLLIIFTIGPQLERMKADSDSQWVRFKEAAAISCEDDFCGSWAGQQPYGGFTLSRGVNRPEEKSTDDWAGWEESLQGCHQSIDQFQNRIEKNGIKFDYDKVTDEEAEQAGQLGVSSKSIILDKVRELMERLIDELGGRVEIDALNALESITQVLIESTGKDYEKQGKNCLLSTMSETENDLSDNEAFLKMDYFGDCEFISRSVSVSSDNLEHVPCDRLEAAKADQKQGKNVGSIAVGEAHHKLLDHWEFPKTGYAGDSEFITRPITAGSLNVQTLEHAQKDSNDGRKQGKLYKLFISEDELSHNGNIQIIDNARDSESIATSGTGIKTSKEQGHHPVPEFLVEDSCSASISSISPAPEKGNTSLHSVGAYISRPEEGRRNLPVQDKHQKVERLSVVQQYELRTHRSLLPGVSKDEFSCINKLREAGDDFGKKDSVIGDGKHQNQTHSNKFSKEQHEHRQSRKLCEELPVPESLVEYSCSESISSISLTPEKGNTSVHSVGVNISRPKEGRRSPLVQDKHQKEELSVVQQYELRARRSLLPGVSKDEFRCINELREAGDVFGKKESVIGDGKYQNQTHSNKFSKDQHGHCQCRKLCEKLTEDSLKYSREFSSPIRIPDHNNKQHYVTAGKLRSIPSDPITYVKKPQLVASPVMLLGTQDMDLLWEEYNDVTSQDPESASKAHVVDFNDDLSEMIDSDTEVSPVCCLQALKFKGKMPLKKPNLKKISKALKKLGIMQHFRGRKTA